MAKMDPKYLRKLAQGIMEHLGKEEEGEDPSIPSPDHDMGGAGSNLSGDHGLEKTAGDHLGPIPGADEPDDKKKKFSEGGAKKKDAAMALLASNLASKFNKPGMK